MTKEEILNGMSEEEFYNLYPTEEAYFMAKGGSLSGAPHNGQPTADEFFSYGAPALGHMNIPMSNPTYLAHGGMYHSDGPFYHAQPGMIINPNLPKAAPVAAPDADAFMTQYDKTNPAVSGFNNPPKNIINTPKFNTRSEYDKFKGNPNFAKYSDADMQGLGFDVPAEPKANLNQKPQRPYTPAGQDSSGAGLFTNAQGQKFKFSNGAYNLYNPPPTPPAIVATKRYGGFQDNSVTEYCWGGLPGGANEMPRMDYGGYMNMGGYNSPTNYGSFSVPMAEGGYYQPGGSNDLVDWAAKQQQMLQQRTNVGIPTNVKKYFGAFDEPRKFDSTHVYPGNPNIEMGFKGNKVMLISKDSDAENTVRRVNKPRTVVGPIVKGERDVYFDYLNPHEYGGVLDVNNNQDYPVMDEGGRSNLMKIIKAAGKKMKKEYAAGGDTTMQGGNQDYIANIKGTYDNFLKQNVYNSLVDQEQQDLSKAFMQKGGQRSFFQMLAENYAPRERASGFNYFPANRNRGYELSNQDYSKLSQLGDDAKLSGLGVNYGLLARGLGKFGRRMFGPKEIYMDFLNYNPSIHNRKPLEPFKGPYPEAGESPFTEGFPAMHTVKEKPVQRYGGLPMAQTGFSNPVDMTMNAIANYKPGPEYLPQKSATDMFAKQTEADLKTRLDNTQAVDTSSAYSKDRVSLKRDNSAFLNAVGQYAVPGINTLAGMIEAPGQQRRQKQAMLNAMTPGSDTGPFAVKPANAMNRGDYDPNTGMFRPNAMVPVQFPGGSYGAYGGSFQDGGMFEEGEELDLSPEEIEELRNQGYEIEELD